MMIPTTLHFPHLFGGLTRTMIPPAVSLCRLHLFSLPHSLCSSLSLSFRSWATSSRSPSPSYPSKPWETASRAPFTKRSSVTAALSLDRFKQLHMGYGPSFGFCTFTRTRLFPAWYIPRANPEMEISLLSPSMCL